MPLFNQGGKRRSARLWDESQSLLSQSSLLQTANHNTPPMSNYTPNNANMAPPPMNESHNNMDAQPTNPPIVPSEEQVADNKAYWDNYFRSQVT